MHRHINKLSFCLVWILASLAHAQDSLKDLEGHQLVKRLDKPAECLAAFRELVRRGNDEKDIDSGIPNPVVVTCPQPDGKEPIRLVLWDFLINIHRGDDPYVGDPELFIWKPQKPQKPHEPLDRLKNLAIYAFDNRGNEIYPVGGNNVVTDGIVVDMNGDGFIEIADQINYSVDGIGNVDTLLVRSVQKEAKPVFEVVYNWTDQSEHRTWSYAFDDPDGDGMLSISLGPKKGNGIEPKVVFEWDPVHKTYKGPQGKSGDHWRVIDYNQPFPRFNALVSAKTTFPVDKVTELEGESRDGPFGERRGLRVPMIVKSSPYQAKSRKDLSDKKLIKFMRGGDDFYDLQFRSQIQSHVPETFWEVGSRKAVLDLANANRDKQHQRKFQIALDHRDGAKPPIQGRLRWAGESSRCFFASDLNAQISLKGDKAQAIFGFTRSDDAAPFSTYELRVLELSVEDAQQLMQAIWWLNRLRSGTQKDINGGIMSSTADGRGQIEISYNRGTGFVKTEGTVWSGIIARRWQAHYNEDAMVSLAALLIEEELPKRYPKQWAKQAPPVINLREKDGKNRQREELAQFQEAQSETIARLLATYAKDAEFLAPKLAQMVIRSAGENAVEQAKASLKAIALRKDESNQGEAKMALEMIGAAKEIDQLEQWVRDHRGGEEWGKAQLKARAPEKLAEILIEQLPAASGSNDNGARRRYQEIKALNAQVHLKYARSIPNNNPLHPLFVPGFNAMQKAKLNVQDRVESMVQILLLPESQPQVRSSAMLALSSGENANPFDIKNWDQILLKVMGMKGEFKSQELAAGYAARELARFAPQKHAPMLFNMAFEVISPTDYTQWLEAAFTAAQNAGPEMHQKLANRLEAEFKSTNRGVSQLLWLCWALDTPALRQVVRRLANDSSEDVEGLSANTYGGEKKPVTQRYHLARRLASIWDEKDLLTKAKMLKLLSQDDHSYDSFDACGEQTERLLRDARQQLPEKDQAAFDRFVKKLDKWNEENSDR